LGYIVVEAPTDQVPSTDEVVAKVRSEAGKLGADAIVVVQPKAAYVSGIRWDGIVETVTDRKLTVVAIKYRPYRALRRLAQAVPTSNPSIFRPPR
jgi:hypothetical protein